MNVPPRQYLCTGKSMSRRAEPSAKGFPYKRKTQGSKGRSAGGRCEKRQPGCTAWHSPASGIAVPMSRMQSSQLSLPPFVGNMQISRTDFSALLLNYGQAAVSSGCGSASGCASAVTCVSSVSAASVCFSCCSFFISYCWSY